MPLGNETTDGTYLASARERADQAQFQKLLDDMKTRGTAPPDEPAPAPAPDTPAPVNGSFWEISRAAAGRQARAVAKDVGTGVMEAPGQIVGGWFDAWRHTGQAVGAFGDWLDKNAPEALVGTPETQAAAAEQRKALRTAAGGGKEKQFTSEEALGIGGQPTSVTGGLVRNISQFMTLYRPAMAALATGGVTGFWAAPGAAGGVDVLRHRSGAAKSGEHGEDAVPGARRADHAVPCHRSERQRGGQPPPQCYGGAGHGRGCGSHRARTVSQPLLHQGEDVTGGTACRNADPRLARRGGPGRATGARGLLR